MACTLRTKFLRCTMFTLTLTTVLYIYYSIRIDLYESSSLYQTLFESPWFKNVLSRGRCAPAKNVAFVKTHKTGGTTTAIIFLNYALANNLTVALPNTPRNSKSYNYISKPGEVMNRNMICPLPEDRREYNILFHHSIYNRTAFREIMPRDSVYVTILREPFDQFVSTFLYYEIHLRLRRFPKFDMLRPISAFLTNPDKFISKGHNFTYTKNKLAQDLGFSDVHLRNQSALKEYLRILEKDFALVMILEYFDESLLLLKRELCWGLQDVIYKISNVNPAKRKFSFTDDDRVAHKAHSSLDYVVYDHFLNIFQRKLSSQDSSFYQELEYFRDLLKRVHIVCSEFKDARINKTEWHDSFVITRERCLRMEMTEIESLQYLYTFQGMRPNINYTRRSDTVLV
ncbi:Galactose-3-O-sulfotransferase 3 [Bulinus truncatus]|nr:Galactose-3-O-sulfotransferase 3 [Bulinus truncatus]